MLPLGSCSYSQTFFKVEQSQFYQPPFMCEVLQLPLPPTGLAHVCQWHRIGGNAADMVSQVANTEEESLLLTCWLLFCLESPTYIFCLLSVVHEDPQVLLGRAALHQVVPRQCLLNETVPSQREDTCLSSTSGGPSQPFLQPAKVPSNSSPHFQRVKHSSQPGITCKHRVYFVLSLVFNKGIGPSADSGGIPLVISCQLAFVLLITTFIMQGYS